MRLVGRDGSGGEVLLGILGGGVPKKMSFYRSVFRPDLQNPYPFSDLALRQKLRHDYLDSVRKQKKSSDVVRIRIFLLLSYSFGIETINTFIRFGSTLENHTRFQTKMGKVYTRFQTKTAQKPYPLGRHIPIYTYIPI